MQRVSRLFLALLVGALALSTAVAPFAALPAQAAPAAIPRYALSDSLIAYWKLDEVSGTRADQLNGCGGSGCDLTDNNTVGSVGGKIGNAGQFVRANNEYLSRTDHSDLDAGAAGQTLAAWVYADSFGAFSVIIGKLVATGNQREFGLAYDNTVDRFRYFVYTDGTSASVANVYANNLGAPSTGTWYFVVAWWDNAGDTINIQINNGTVDTTSFTGTMFDGTANFQIGAYNGSSSWWDGRIDEVGLWHRPLTSQERTWLYNAGAGCTHTFTACEPTPTPTASNTPTNTPLPTATDTPVPTDTDTPVPTDTDTPEPTDTHTPDPAATDTDTPEPTETDTPGPTPTDTPIPSDTPVPTETLTPGPDYWYELPLTSGNVLRVERRWGYGELFVGLAVLLVAAVLLLRWLYDLVRQWIWG